MSKRVSPTERIRAEIDALFASERDLASTLGQSPQLNDIRALEHDAERRGWTSEIARHQRVADRSTTTSAGSTSGPLRKSSLDRTPFRLSQNRSRSVGGRGPGV